MGFGYSASLPGLDVKNNTYMPLAPVGYSDKLGENINSFDLVNKDRDEQLTHQILSKDVTDYGLIETDKITSLLKVLSI